MLRFCLAVLFLACALPSFAASQLVVVSWNLESGQADPGVVAERVKALQGVDLWGFSEVPRHGSFDALRTAAADGEASNFTVIQGTTGNNDRLMIVFDSGRLEKLEDFELPNINIDDTVRAPLVARFRDLESGREFLFMVNHLARGDRNNGTPNRRLKQAEMLNTWAEQQTLPVIAAGDYNLDLNIGPGTSHPSFAALFKDDHFRWVRPVELYRTQCTAEDDGCHYDSVLDFIITAGGAKQWPATSVILVGENDFPDTDDTSDHRPVLAVFHVPEP